jgi:hypothetical protein
MKINKVLAITLYRRQDTQLFECLRKCYGIEDYHIFISCDHNDEYRDACLETQEVAHRFASEHGMGKTTILINNPRLGIDRNKMFLLPIAFEMSDFVVFLEDDTLPSSDALRYFEFCGQKFRTDRSVMSVSGFNRYLESETHERILREEAYAIDRGIGFCPWGWGMWKDRYARIMGDGKAYEDRWGVEVNGRFDWWFTEMAKTSEEPLYSIYPVLPRTNHVGADRAEHTPSKEWLMEHEFAPYGAWTQEMQDPVTDLWYTKF